MTGRHLSSPPSAPSRRAVVKAAATAVAARVPGAAATARAADVPAFLHGIASGDPPP